MCGKYEILEDAIYTNGDQEVITDEVDLGPFLGDYKDEANPEKEKAVERHRRLKDFLSDMGW